MKKNVIVVIPAYNEEETIREVIERSLPFADVCIVNDGSKDRTAEIVQSIPNVTCINHIKNTHIPKAILDGFKYALAQGYEYVITMDAGLSHTPEEMIHFLDVAHSDLVIGVRSEKKNTPAYRRFLSYMATFLINISLRPINSDLTPAKFHDVTSGFRRYSRESVRLLLSRKIKAKSFDFHTEALMFIYRNGLTITEIPITYEFSNSSLNMKVISDSVKMLFNISFTRRK
jgi:dolichol-phosphate mannosyltransferase